MTSSSQPLILIYKSSNSLIYYQAASEYDRPVVVKVLNTEHPTAQQLIRFNNEYEITKELTVEGVRKAIAQTRLEDKPALVLEYITGQTLKQTFVEQQQSLIDFLQVAIRIAKILGELHQHHLIHRDINSHNILVNLETKQVNIIDFSLASRLDLRVQHLGNPEGLAGTLAYISPEQTGRMNRVVDYRTDLYSLGVTFYQLLTGHLPFESNDPLALVHAHLAKAPRPVTALNPDVPAILSDIIIKLLAKNAEDRYQSAFGLKADLGRCLAALTDPQGLQNLKSLSRSNVLRSSARPRAERSRTGRADSSNLDVLSLSFELGQDDFSGRFQLPQKLYGRSNEITTLLTVFERVTAGSQELMLITGDPGTGKSALVVEVHKSITEKRGYFISGKFDQYQQHTPYVAFSQAFNQFADLLLTEREATLQQWRDKILAAVGSNGAVLTEVIPRLEQVIGPQPAVTKLGGQENRNRFNLTFQNFVQAISTAEHPLVVFIDDWQWADLASLELIKVLLANETNSHLLLIGAYRDNEVDRTRPFMMTLNGLTAAEITMQIIKLDNLQPVDVSQLIQESIGGTVVDNQPLVELVYEKTQGNAFFTRQFLQNLYEEGWLRFDFNTHRWMWDMAQLKAQNITANLVELMADKLKRLSQQTIHLLQLAACIGNKFNLQTLALISQMSESTVLTGLEEALNQGLIIPLDDYYNLPGAVAQADFSFLHDRVQQAAYAQISASERQNIHLEIGRLLLGNIPTAALEQRVFDIVQHYNQASSLVTDEPERLRLAELNMQAADLAYSAAAFHSAQSYLETALTLMPADAWVSRYDQMLRLHSQLANILALTRNFEQLDQVVQTTEAQAKYEAEFGHLLIQPQAVSETVEITPVTHTSTSSQSTSKNWLDIASLLKVNQTLSETVQLTDLLAEMMKILLENAGAEKAFILYQRKAGWFIEAGGEVESQAIQTMMHLPLTEATMLSRNVCNYVIHSGQTVILANAAKDPQFATDPYLRGRAVKSVLCLPIWHKGELRLVLYLENNLVEGSFTERRLELLQLLSGQMVISLENALMVDSLITLLADYRQTEETLRLTRFTVDSVTDAVYWVEPEAARFVDVNEAACRLLGYTREELLNMSVADFDPQFSPAQWSELWKYIKEKGKLTVEAEQQTKDGRLIPVEIVANYIQFGDRELNCAIVRNITRRKQMDEALRQSEERLQQAVRVSHIGMFDHNHLTDIIYWSPEQRQNYGWEPEETVSLPEFLEQVYHEDRERIEEAVRRAHDPTGDGLFDVEYRIVRRDGAIRWVAARSQTFFEGEGSARRLLRTIGATLDITEFRQVENQLKASLQEKEVLLKEIHHRVKNNMQIISSLLDLQADNIEDQAIREIFQESRQRIKSMALIHERLYQSKDLSCIDFVEYVENLTNHLLRSYGARAGHIELHLAIEPVSLSIETAIPCGLIINELVSNVFKHAFPDGKTGQIWVELSTTENQQLSLIVKDNGVGFPKDIDLHRTTSLGLTLVNTLTKQINGALELNKSSGTEFKITFSNRRSKLWL